MSDEVAIKVEHLSKSFKLPHEKTGSLKSVFLGWRKGRRGYETQHVLKDVSFEVKKGEFFGIVGRNGSGKSTLLKLISQIYEPGKGSVTVNGKLTPFIELGVGFNPELSGRDNVYLNGALLGFSRDDMDVMYDEIVEFAELGRFMDQKLKNYSSGMQVRLAFSIAIRANTDVLVLDEVLAVGDESFQQKCIEVFERYKKERKTIILVTHDMSMVERFCDKAMVLHQGEIDFIGLPRKAAIRYSNQNLPTPTNIVDTSGDIQITILDDNGNETSTVYEGEYLTVSVAWSDPTVQHVGVAVARTSGETLFGPNTFADGQKIGKGGVLYKVRMSVAPGKYYLEAATFGRTDAELKSRVNEGPVITVLRSETEPPYVGLARLEHHWLPISKKEERNA